MVQRAKALHRKRLTTPYLNHPQFPVKHSKYTKNSQDTCSDSNGYEGMYPQCGLLRRLRQEAFSSSEFGGSLGSIERLHCKTESPFPATAPPQKTQVELQLKLSYLKTEMLVTNRQKEESKTRQRRLQAGYLTHRTPCAPQGASDEPVFPLYT